MATAANSNNLTTSATRIEPSITPSLAVVTTDSYHISAEELSDRQREQDEEEIEFSLQPPCGGEDETPSEAVFEDDEDNLTIIDTPFDYTAGYPNLRDRRMMTSYRETSSPWVLGHNNNSGNEDEDELARRDIMLHELERLQSYNFCHFVTWCLVPTILMIFLFIFVFKDSQTDALCSESLAPGITCRQEDRQFYQAFIARCRCDPIVISSYS